MNKLKFLCAGIDSHIHIFYSEFHTLKYFYIIRQQSGETVKKYFDRFQSARVNAELSKGRNQKGMMGTILIQKDLW